MVNKSDEKIMKSLVAGGIAGAVAGWFTGFIGAIYEIPIIFVMTLSIIVAMIVISVLYMFWR